jgi:hypothetical protein
MNEETNQKIQKDLFEELNIANIPDEEKGALLAHMLEVVQTRVILRISEMLSEEDMAKFNSMVEAEEDDAKIDDFLNEKVPNIDELYKEEASKLRQELIIDSAE